MPKVRRPYGRGFESQRSKVASAPTAKSIGFGTRIQTPVRQETAFVCPEDGHISFYAATMESFQTKKNRESILIRSFPQRFGATMEAPSGCILIEST